LPINWQENKLEKLAQLYDDTGSDNFFSLGHTTQGMNDNQLNRFIQKLLTTIDLPVLAELFYQQLTSTLQLSGLKIQFNDVTINFGESNNTSNIKTLNSICQDGITSAISYGFNHVLGPRDWQVLQQMHLYFRHPLKNALEYRKVKQFAMKDYLTSLGNRANFDETLDRLISQANRYERKFGLLMIDMDRFKQVNDQFGHGEGDNVLISCANTLKRCLRDTDFAFRFGGDEFCCLLADSDGQTNTLIAQRILDAMQSNALLKKYGVSCSIGSSLYLAGDCAISLFTRADKALYGAKQTGRGGFIAA
jgi:diguanylate cyclase (GGDEF)-like protein